MLSRVELAGYQRGRLAPAVAALLPEKDQPVLAAAIRLKCDALVTGDRTHEFALRIGAQYEKCDALVTGDRTHFGALYGRVVEGMAIHSPRTLAEALGLSRMP